MVFAWALPSWLGNIDLDTQMYVTKANVDFITVNLLNWTEVWAPLIPASIATIILIYPKKLILGLPLRSKNFRKNFTILFSIIIFGLSYVISLFANDFSYGVFMSNYLQGDESFVDIFSSFNALLIPFNHSLYDTNVLLTWQYLTLPLVNTIITALLIRSIMEIVGQRLIGGYPIEFLGRIFITIGLILTYFFLSAPLSIYDRVERTWLYIVPLTMSTFLIIGIFCLAFSKTSPRRNREEIAGGTFIIAIIIVIGMIVGPCIAAAGDFFNRENKWNEIVWDGKIQQSVQQTRIASDLIGFDYRQIENLTNQPSNYVLPEKVRQYDKNSSKASLESLIDEEYETKDDTDIVLVNGTEYWIAPKSFFSNFSGFDSAFARHGIYTHTDGFIAMDAHSGQTYVSSENYTSIFGVNSSYPIYFGEGYRNDIVLTLDVDEINERVYSGEPDGSLSGLYGWWKMVGMSIDFLPLAGNENSYLRRTNIYDRVRGMLLPYMYLGEGFSEQTQADPYLVFDQGNGRLYYSMPVYISLPQFAYYQTNYKRFLGWVIIDVLNGEMDFYQSPGLDKESLISFAKVYVDTDIYPWQSTIPDWLKSQLRYPENLYESQLRTDYIYHMQDPNVWRGQSDRYARPENSDLYYVLMDLGEGIEFVGIDIVEPPSAANPTLAGMYLIRQKASHFGQTIFYKSDDNNPLIGPSTANDTFFNFPGIAQNLTLVPGRDAGNILLYPFARSLYYMIPVYSTSPQGIQTLNYVGLVNGFNKSEVVWGQGPNAAVEAFEILRDLYPEPGEYRIEDLDFTYDYDKNITQPDLANLSIVMRNAVENLSQAPVNLTVNMTVYSQNTSLYINGTTSGVLESEYNSTYKNGTNYQVGSWLLYPQQTRGITAQLDMNIGNFSKQDLEFEFTISIINDSSGEVIDNQTYDQELMTFFSTNYSSNNINAGDISMDFDFPDRITEPNDALMVLSLFNNETNLSASPLDVVVNLTVFSSNVSIFVPGEPILENATFTTDDLYPYAGINYTVVDTQLSPQELFGLTFALDLDMGNSTTIDLVYYVTLIVDGTTVSNTLLRVISWSSV